MANVEGDPVLLQVGKEEIVKTKQPKTITNSIGMKLVLIPAGKFKMGSPRGEENRGKDEEQHDVTICKAFYMGVYEVTQKQYRTVMGKNPSYFSKDDFYGADKVKGMNTDDFPVEQVNWQEATDFCKRLTALAAETKKGPKYRLPTEAEWEYACRGGVSSYSTFHYGNSLSSTQANFDGNYPYGGGEKGPKLGRTCKVGSYKPNGFGLHDMHGNVLEWCSDWYSSDYYATSPKRDPQGPFDGSSRVFRGGCWGRYGRGQDCRAAFRTWNSPSHRDNNMGFRVAAVPRE
jgi:formylglycine-generating enzyme required for sulfatase activity